MFLTVLTVYVLVTPRPHGFYHHHILMAKAFLAGRVHLTSVPAHYQDLIYVADRVYAPFQPLPAVLLMPMVAVQGEAAHPGRMGQIAAAFAVAIFVGALGRLGRPRRVRLFVGLALGLGSVLWSATAIGSTWFIAHVVVVLALALLLRELAGPARGAVVGLWLACAYLSRATLLPAVPAVAAILVLRHGRWQPLAGFAGATVAGVAGLLLYNVLRFGQALEFGYGMVALAVPSALTVQQSGTFNLQYLAPHLHTLLWRPPELIPTWPLIRPHPEGMAVLFTSPLIARLLWGGVGRIRWLAWGSPIVLVASLSMMYFSTGWVQFGYRYSLDWWPFLLVLLAFALDRGPRRLDMALLTISIVVNWLGVYWVRILGW